MDAHAIADALLTARRERKAIAPLTDDHPELDLAGAYEVQDLFFAGLLAEGERVVGAKLGLTSRAKQEVMNVGDPLYGRVTDSMLLEHGAAVDVDNLIQPRAEPEIAFLLARELAGPATVTSVLAATDVVMCAVDVLDSRYENYRFQLPDVVADNCSSGRFLLGPLARRPDEMIDVRLVGCVLRSQGNVVATAAGAASMGHPAAAVAWLANRLAERGESLPAGSLVFSGGLTAPIPISHGSHITAEFDGLGMVEVYA
jgi:2-oxo-3-hexenedioate decarboxylase